MSNAGIELLGQDDRVDRLDRAVWDRLLTTNLTGQFLACKHGARHLLATGGGAIVCLGSNCAYLGMATNEPAYSASKGGILAMMKVMAIDYARLNIRVNMVVPGFIDTPMNAPVMGDAEGARLLEQPDPDRPAPARAEECAVGDPLAGLRRGELLHRHDAGGRWRTSLDLACEPLMRAM